MGKRKWQAQHEEYLTQIMDVLRVYDFVKNIGQGPYKDDLFKIFEDAFRAGFCEPGYRFDTNTHEYVRCQSQRPLISGEAIWLFAEAQAWVHAEMDGSDKKYEDIQQVSTWWDEWTYAWSRYPSARKLKRR